MAMTHATPRTNWAAIIEGCLTVGLGTMLLRKVWDGLLPMYIHPRYTILVAITAAVLLLIGAARVWQAGAGGLESPLRNRIGMYGLVLAPLLLGILIPATPAGSALVDPQQLNVSRRGYRAPQALPTDKTGQWTLMEWMFARFLLEPEDVAGKPVDVIGFVYHAPDAPADEFYVVRYTVACCIADRTSVSLPVRAENAAALPNDRWVRVRGVIEQRPVAEGKDEIVVVDAQIETVPQPPEPYLYP
jgi:putative membrane protein